ncbi:hypothetical protein Y1Q_0010968 [Alligator mississippiensis]|uniref:Uncharacterized protein n=1 Tax=Alligator mississippiensis TaxID=8496 RepID=A0A151NWD9_ALLMI|nr:hypothetical protein Y1Q_0010968 [Alligator mississippiensis]
MGIPGEKGRCVEDEYDADMRAARPNYLVPSLLGLQPKDGPEDKAIRNSNERNIQPYRETAGGQPKPDVDPDIRTGQPGNAHVLAVRVSHDVMSTVGQPLEEEDSREHIAKVLHNYPKLLHDWENNPGGYFESQGVADGHIRVKRHGHQDPQLYNKGEVDQEHLGEADVEGNLY